jgi:flagellar hook-basal body complex protein FliE
MDIQRLNALLDTQWTAAQPKVDPAPQGQGPSFSEVLKGAIEAVERDQTAAHQAAVKLATGEINDIAEVMIASERANLSLGLAIQVRNKVLEAYQEIMRMPL